MKIQPIALKTFLMITVLLASFQAFPQSAHAYYLWSGGYDNIGCPSFYSIADGATDLGSANYFVDQVNYTGGYGYPGCIDRGTQCYLNDTGGWWVMYCDDIPESSCTVYSPICGIPATGSTINGSGCDVSAPPDPSYAGQSCTPSNACGTNSGTLDCNDNCSVSAPTIPANYDQSCKSASTNACGAYGYNGTTQCDSSCSSTPPPDSTCNQPPSAPTLWGLYDNSTATYYGASAPAYHPPGYAEYATASDPEGSDVDYLFYFYDTRTSQYIVPGAWSGWVGSGQSNYYNALANLPPGNYLVGAYAEDRSGALSSFSGWATVTLTATPPVVTNVTISAANIIPDGSTAYTITTTGSDTAGASDLGQQYALINYQGANAGSYRGMVWWGATPAWGWGAPTAPAIACTGGGVAQKYGDTSNNNAYGAAYTNLLSCATSVSGNTRTTSWTVSFSPSFTSPTTNNTLSGYVWSGSSGLGSGWNPFNTFGLAPLPDLSAGGTTVSGSLTAGMPITFSATASNIGMGTGTNFPNLYEITDIPVTQVVGFVDGGTKTLAPSASTGLSGQTTLPAGSYAVRACANYSASPPWSGSIPETNINDDCGAYQPFTITPPLPSCTLSSASPTIIAGQSTSLTWACTNATSCTAAGGFSTGGAPNNATGVSVTPSRTSNYQMSCTGPGGTANSNVAVVTVIQPTAYITASPPRVANADDQTTLSFSATNVTSCAISASPNTGFVPWSSGSVSNVATTTQVEPVPTQTRYTLTCTTSGNPVSSSVLVNTNPGTANF